MLCPVIGCQAAGSKKVVPQFRNMDPQDVKIGRGIASAAMIEAIAEAIADQGAGSIDLDEGEKEVTFRRYLRLAAKQNGMKVRSTFDAEQNAILWKVVGA